MDDWEHAAATLALLADEPGARKRPVIVAPSASAPYGWAIRLLGILKRAGFADINFKQGAPGKGKLDAPARGQGHPQAPQLPPRRDHTVVVVTRAGTDAKPVPRIAINGVQMADWAHVGRSFRHLAGADPKARAKIRVTLRCAPDAPFGWVHACMAGCVEAGIWRVGFGEPWPPPGEEAEP